MLTADDTVELDDYIDQLILMKGRDDISLTNLEAIALLGAFERGRIATQLIRLNDLIVEIENNR